MGISTREHILFVCGRNQWRSPTAEALLAGSELYEARSAGTGPRSRVRVDEGLLGWADRIFVMEAKHRERMLRKFPEALADKPVVVLRVKDRYEFMQPELIARLRKRLEPHLDLPEA